MDKDKVLAAVLITIGMIIAGVGHNMFEVTVDELE